MAKIKIVSNPYNQEISYYCLKENQWEDIKSSNADSQLREDESGKAFLPFKIKEIIDIIINEYYANDEKVCLEFEGTQDEYNEAAAVCQSENLKDKIILSRSDRMLENARIIFEPTKTIFSLVQPIIEKIVKDDDNVIKKLNKVSDALKDIIPICVFGNYSAGKSTFINALIGSEILPSGGDPVTAKIYKIERSKNMDVARIRFSYKEEKFELLFEGNNYRTVKGNTSNELILDIDAAISNLNSEDMSLQINAALVLINGYEKTDPDTILISNVIELEVPFSKNGILGQSYNNFVIFDTPGSNSSSNIEHSAVLDKALEGFSNGIPVWISTYENIDSTDNASLCEKILNIPALDKRFTMIVLNKADGSDLSQEGFSKQKEHEILEYSSVEKMYSSGIYFVSSIMGIGAKNDGKLLDNHYRKIFRSQQEMYSNPKDEDYATLYKYNIMPEQIKTNVIEYSQNVSNLIYANSGLYCIECEMENFASKYAAYNKCQMVYIFLTDIIEETNRRIIDRTESLKRTREARKRELETAKAQLIDELDKTAQTAEDNYEKGALAFIKDFTDNNLVYKYSAEDLEKQAEDLRNNNSIKNDRSHPQKDYEESRDHMFSHFKENGKNIFKGGFVNSVKNLKDEFTRDYNVMKENREILEQTDKEIDKQTSDELLAIVVNEYKENALVAKELLNASIKEHWQNNAQTLRNILISTITGSNALSSAQREQLSEIILNYQSLEFNDDADSIFIKERFLNGRVLGLKFSDSEKLNIRRLANSYNDTIKKNVNNMASVMNSSCHTSFKSWKESLSAVIEENITDYNPQLRDMSDMIREETEKIAELEDYQGKICKALDSIKDLMAWKTLE